MSYSCAKVQKGTDRNLSDRSFFTPLVGPLAARNPAFRTAKLRLRSFGYIFRRLVWTSNSGLSVAEPYKFPRATFRTATENNRRNRLCPKHALATVATAFARRSVSARSYRLLLKRIELNRLFVNRLTHSPQIRHSAMYLFCASYRHDLIKNN